MKAHVVIELHMLDYETGLWCPTCALPSVCQLSVATVDPEDLRMFGRLVWRVCDDCGTLRPVTEET